MAARIEREIDGGTPDILTVWREDEGFSLCECVRGGRGKELGLGGLGFVLTDKSFHLLLFY